MRPNKVGGGSHDKRGDGGAPARFVGKGRYTNAAPMTPATGTKAGDEIEVQVGDITLVIRPDEVPVPDADKYSARSAPAYRLPDAASDEVGATTAEQADSDLSPIPDLLVDDPVPQWTEWRSEVVSSSVGYHRRETRLPR
jgi:hypothetical protein